MNKISQKLDFNQTLFQVYQQPVTNTKPHHELVSLRRFLTYTAEPGNRIIEIFDLIKEAEQAGDQAEKARLKRTYLLYFTVCVVVSKKRNYESILYFTGLLVLDFDHIDNAADFKQFLFDEYKFIIACWLSPSKRGVKALVKIPIVQTVDQFKEYYFGIAAEMEQYNGFDPSGQNCVLPLFQSYDPDLLERDDPETWTIKGTKRGNFNAGPAIDRPIVDANDHDKETIIKIIDTGFKNIIDSGHPAVRSLCLTIGGYIASGYINQYDALRQIDYNIETHGYLKKGISGYKRTAHWAINEGQSKPLLFNYRTNG